LATPTRASDALATRLVGPVRQVGRTIESLADHWVRDELRVRVVAEEAVRAVTVEGRVPDGLDHTLSLRFALGGDISSSEFGSGPFHWEIPCALAAGTEAELVLTAPPTWDRILNGSGGDKSSVAFVLERLGFEPVGG
jgi:hypothetical protein